MSPSSSSDQSSDLHQCELSDRWLANWRVLSLAVGGCSCVCVPLSEEGGVKELLRIANDHNRPRQARGEETHFGTSRAS